MALRRLHVSDATETLAKHLTELMLSLNVLPGLRHVIMRNCCLLTLPQMSFLQRVTSLDLSSNQFTSMPESLQTARACRVLDLRCSLKFSANKLDPANLSCAHIPPMLSQISSPYGRSSRAVLTRLFVDAAVACFFPLQLKLPVSFHRSFNPFAGPAGCLPIKDIGACVNLTALRSLGLRVNPRMRESATQTRLKEEMLVALQAVLANNAGGPPKFITGSDAAFPEVEALNLEPDAFQLDTCWGS